MKNNIFSVFIGILLISCANPVPRNPIVIKSGSYLEESVSLNKFLIESEEVSFKEFIKKDSINSYIASPLGFWYTYTSKNNTSYFPKFGDKVAYKNMDVCLTFNEVNTHVDALVWYLQNKTNLKQIVVEKYTKLYPNAVVTVKSDWTKYSGSFEIIEIKFESGSYVQFKLDTYNNKEYMYKKHDAEFDNLNSEELLNRFSKQVKKEALN